jgi:hypothetical protein
VVSNQSSLLTTGIDHRLLTTSPPAYWPKVQYPPAACF